MSSNILKKIFRKIKRISDKLTFSYRQSKDFDKDFPELYPLALSNNEIGFILKNCKDANSYLEFGAGGSTFLSLLNLNNLNKIVSVESDPNWIAFLKKWKIIKNACDSNKLCFHYADIGKTGAWGVPVGGDAEKKYPGYSSSVFEHEFVENNDFDVVFIDGRFRVACLLQTILNVPAGTKIFIHDFCTRTKYHIVLKYLDVVEPIDNLCLFKIKDNLDKNEVISEYEKYKCIYD